MIDEINNSIAKSVKQAFHDKHEYLGQFDESYRSKEYARFIRDGEYIYVRKVEEPKDDPRSPQDMQVCYDEYMAFLHKIEEEEKFNRKYSR